MSQHYEQWSYRRAELEKSNDRIKDEPYSLLNNCYTRVEWIWVEKNSKNGLSIENCCIFFILELVFVLKKKRMVEPGALDENLGKPGALKSNKKFELLFCYISCRSLWCVYDCIQKSH